MAKLNNLQQYAQICEDIENLTEDQNFETGDF